MLLLNDHNDHNDHNVFRYNRNILKDYLPAAKVLIGNNKLNICPRITGKKCLDEKRK